MMAIRTKAARHQFIVETLSRQTLHTQEELRETLMSAGFDITQATLSRDLDELQAVKVPSANGSIYAIVTAGDPTRKPAIAPDADIAQRFARVASEVITGVDSAMNMVVIHTKPGAAHYLAGALDRNAMPHVVGSVAGDDTVLVVTPSIDAASEIAQLIRELLSNRSHRKGARS